MGLHASLTTYWKCLSPPDLLEMWTLRNVNGFNGCITELPFTHVNSFNLFSMGRFTYRKLSVDYFQTIYGLDHKLQKMFSSQLLRMIVVWEKIAKEGQNVNGYETWITKRDRPMLIGKYDALLRILSKMVDSRERVKNWVSFSWALMRLINILGGFVDIMVFAASKCPYKTFFHFHFYERS